MEKAPVTVRALEARVRRALEKQGEALRKCKTNSRWYSELGDHYTVDLTGNFVIAKHVDLEELARELGVLKQYEALEEAA